MSKLTIFPDNPEIRLERETILPTGETVRLYRQGCITVRATSSRPSERACQAFATTLHTILERIVDSQ